MQSKHFRIIYNRTKLTQNGMLHHILPLVFVVIFAITGVGYLVYAHAATSSSPEIKSDMHETLNWCVNDENSSIGAKNPVDSAVCNGSAAQQWTFNAGLIKNVALSGTHCLEPKNGATGAGSVIVMDTCNGHPSQGWAYIKGVFHNVVASKGKGPGECLAVYGGVLGRQLRINTCHPTYLTQNWSLKSVTKPTPPPPPPSGAVTGFDEAGVSAGIGDNFTASQWTAIANSGVKLFITDPIDYGSECSNGNCDKPVNTCTVDPAAVAQIQDAYNVGVDYAVYTRNVNCLTTAIKGLSNTLQAHLSFAVLDIETGPSVKLTQALVDGVTALGQTPVVYSYQGAWESMMNNTTSFDNLALQDGEVANWGLKFPAPYPSGFPTLVNMPNPYGGWSGKADIEQQQANAEIGGINDANDAVDIDAVNAAWLSGLPHQD